MSTTATTSPQPSRSAAGLDPALAAGNQRPLAGYAARHVGWSVEGSVATLTLDRPTRKNPITFDIYAELRDLFAALRLAPDVRAVVLTGAGGNFCSGGDVHEIIGPLVDLPAPELLMFTRMTGDVVKAMRACPQPILAAVDGVCAGAGAILAMASDLRLGTARSKTAFLFNRVGLAGCDMGACAILPRLVGQGRASELLYTGRALGGEEGERWGWFNRLCAPEELLAQTQALAAELAQGPAFANGVTKAMLHQEWSMSVDQAIEAEAQAQALCMLTEDFRRAYEAFVARQRPVFVGR
jgi:enoyl-CoA hydratase/carnithine racemase